MFVIITMEPIKISFIIVTPIILLLVIAILLYRPIRKSIYKKRFRELYGRKVYKLALYEDYYLINLFHLKFSDYSLVVVDHVLLAEKYIYVILDRYYNGSITGKLDDPSLVLISSKGKKQYIPNPINDIKQIVKRISLMSGIDKSLFVGIILINKECSINIERSNEDYYIIQVDKLKKLVGAIESRDVATINENQLQRFVNDLDKINSRRKKNVKN